jgi:hypothetical protein
VAQDSGLRSYIILMGNYVRLTADAQPPSEYLKSFLISHIQWKEFVPLLKYAPPGVHSPTLRFS